MAEQIPDKLKQGQEARASACIWKQQHKQIGMRRTQPWTLSMRVRSQTSLRGSIVTGRIIRVHDGDVIIDIGYKSKGVIDANEFRDLEEDPVGLEVDVFLERLEDDDGAIVIKRSGRNSKKPGTM